MPLLLPSLPIPGKKKEKKKGGKNTPKKQRSFYHHTQKFALLSLSPSLPPLAEENQKTLPHSLPPSLDIYNGGGFELKAAAYVAIAFCGAA